MVGFAEGESFGPLIKLMRELPKLILAAILGAAISLGGDWGIEHLKNIRDRENLLMLLINNVEIMQARHSERLSNWDDYMERLVSKDAAVNADARPDLMPEAFQQNPFGPFEKALERLHLLEPDLTKKILNFYAVSTRLEAEIRLLTGPSILRTGREDQIWLREENRKTQATWDHESEELLVLLKSSQ